MRQIELPTRPTEDPFEYYCPICGMDLDRFNYETVEKDYFCPYCSTQQRASRVPVGRR